MTEKNAGASRRQTRRAHDRAPVKPIVQQDVQRFQKVQTYRDMRHEDELRRNFKCGFLLGLLVGLVILCLVVWFWAMPTVDACLEQVQGVTA